MNTNQQNMTQAQPNSPGTPPRQSPGVTPDPNKVRDPNTETPSKVEEPAKVEFPDIAKPDVQPQTGKGGNVTPPKEPAE